MRQPMQIQVILYRRRGGAIEYCVMHRADCDLWQFVNGGVEEGESIEQAAIREVREETSVEVTALMPLTSMAYLPTNMYRRDILDVFPADLYVVPEYSFACEYDGDVVLSDEHCERRWLGYDEAKRLLRWNNNATALFELNCRLLGARQPR